TNARASAARATGGPSTARGGPRRSTCSSAWTRYPRPPRLHSALAVIQVFLSVGVIFLVLLHSGKDAGMSGAFGVGAAGGTSGGSLMERNLDRWTILFAILFAANTIALLKT